MYRSIARAVNSCQINHGRLDHDHSGQYLCFHRLHPGMFPQCLRSSSVVFEQVTDVACSCVNQQRAEWARQEVRQQNSMVHPFNFCTAKSELFPTKTLKTDKKWNILLCRLINHSSSTKFKEKWWNERNLHKSSASGRHDAALLNRSQWIWSWQRMERETCPVEWKGQTLTLRRMFTSKVTLVCFQQDSIMSRYLMIYQTLTISFSISHAHTNTHRHKHRSIERLVFLQCFSRQCQCAGRLWSPPLVCFVPVSLSYRFHHLHSLTSTISSTVPVCIVSTVLTLTHYSWCFCLTVGSFYCLLVCVGIHRLSSSLWISKGTLNWTQFPRIPQFSHLGAKTAKRPSFELLLVSVADPHWPDSQNSKSFHCSLSLPHRSGSLPSLLFRALLQLFAWTQQLRAASCSIAAQRTSPHSRDTSAYWNSSSVSISSSLPASSTIRGI